MGFFLREIEKTIESEIDLVTRRCMDTVLETIPEFENDPLKAHLAFGNFTFEQMKEMIKGSLTNSNYHTIVAVANDSKQLIGHAIFSLKFDSEGRKFGSCYSRYVVPAHRREGVASAMLTEAEKWWAERGAEYALAQTHIKNLALQKLFRKHEFILSEISMGKFPCYELRKSLK